VFASIFTIHVSKIDTYDYKNVKSFVLSIKEVEFELYFKLYE
jgi:hypothetical protein